MTVGTLGTTPLPALTADVMDDTEQVAAPIVMRSTSHLDDDLMVIAKVHGLSVYGAVREGLTLLFGMFVDIGPDGFIKLDPTHHATTIGIEPAAVMDGDTTNVTYTMELFENDAFILDMLCEKFELVPQDVLRHAIHTCRAFRDHALMGGTIRKFGSVGPADA